MNTSKIIPFLLSLSLNAISSHASSSEISHPENLDLCSSKPNCVSSTHQKEDEHYTAPWTYEGSEADTIQKLKSIIENQARTNITKESSLYLKIEFRSWLFSFIDDIEFLLAPSTKRIHVRSESRSGHWDFGVNRKRIESLREQFDKKQAPSTN